MSATGQSKRQGQHLLGLRQSAAMLLFLFVVTGLACEPAEKVELTADPDSRPAMDSMPTDGGQPVSQDASRDTAEPAGDVGVLNDSGCTPRAEECSNQQDDDCDGRTDECPAGFGCQDNECAPLQEGACATNLDCDDTTVCYQGRCEPMRPENCNESTACGHRSQCTTVDVCGAEASCFGTLGADCVETCDCAGQLICRELNATCVECLHDGQCDGNTHCNPAGLCAPIVSLLTADPGSVRADLLSQVLACGLNAAGRHAIGCATFAQTEAEASAADPAAVVQPSALLNGETCAGLVDDAPESVVLRSLLGCDEEPARLLWTEPLPLNVSTVACLSYVPYVPADVSGATEWRLILGPCESTLSAIISQ